MRIRDWTEKGDKYDGEWGPNSDYWNDEGTKDLVRDSLDQSIKPTNVFNSFWVPLETLFCITDRAYLSTYRKDSVLSFIKMPKLTSQVV